MSQPSQHILVAENNSSLAGLIRSNLEKAGFQVTVVEDGRDAWNQLNATTFDLVITDYAMRDKVGSEVCRGLRQSKNHASIPLIVIATAGDVDLNQLAADLHLEATFTKPLSMRQLVATAQKLLTGGADAAAG